MRSWDKKSLPVQCKINSPDGEFLSQFFFQPPKSKIRLTYVQFSFDICQTKIKHMSNESCTYVKRIFDRAWSFRKNVWLILRNKIFCLAYTASM